ncbi:alpha/beta fold hydrolase [Thermopolyspora sp. NPDC052614]|uniref:thioesterase II family protein n=1 Tax=Thermopolyspora sp. NPDC052614 TaxID=3155682 RepID=UPI00343550DB
MTGIGRWLPGQEPSPYAGRRLICLPYAGGAAAAYQIWRWLAPDGLQVCPVELPGRGARFGEDLFQRLTPLVETLADAIAPALDRPFAIFGHSMGALLAFELTRTLRKFGLPEPEHLFVSGAVAPGTPRRERPLHDAPDNEIRRKLRTLGGTPEELLGNDELMELMLPVLRADFAVLETYEYREQAPLAVPITVLAGRSDPVVPVSALRGWRDQSTVPLRLRLFPGGHFYLHDAAADIVRLISDTLRHARQVERK